MVARTAISSNRRTVALVLTICGSRRSASASRPSAAPCRRVPRRPRRGSSRPFGWAPSPSKAGPGFRPWCRGGRTEDGVTTDAVVEWYGRFARGRPGAIVVEATGIRDVPSGPLLRIGDDRFLPGLARSSRRCGARAAAARNSSSSSSISSRSGAAPTPSAMFAEFLTITDRHRAALGDALRRPSCAPASPPCRASELERVLSAREIEALDYGARERVTDTERAHIDELPLVLPGLFADAAARARGGVRRGRAPLRPRLHHGVVPLRHQHARRRLWRGAREPRPPAARGVRRGARTRRRGLRRRLPLPRRRVHRGRQRRRGRGLFRASIRARRHGFPVDSRAAANSTTPSSRGSATRPIPIPGPAATSACRSISRTSTGPFGRNIAPTAAIRAAVRAAGCDTPIVCSGGVHSFAMAERMLAEGACDIVAAARQSLADPDWFLKLSLAAATRCGNASSPITAKGSTRSTSR